MKRMWGRWLGLATAFGMASSLTTLVAEPVMAAEGIVADAPPPWSVVVKVSTAAECSAEGLAAKYAFERIDTVLASRQVHLVQSVDPAKWTTTKADDLASKLDGDACVVYAERNRTLVVDDARFNAWPTGAPKPATVEQWRDQPGSARLELDRAQALSRGSGVKIAVLDTGVDAGSPDFEGRVLSGWDYVDDDADPSEVIGDVHGHGTFVAGVVHLVAPDAQIIPMRVLDQNGHGDGYRIAEAIRDAVAMGARVINLSFGTTDEIESKVLTDMIKYARSKGVLTTGAAGNDGDEAKHWPAAQPEVVSVSSLAVTNASLASYSTRGDWVDVAALGTELISLMPGGSYDMWSGTSMATPVVTAQLAMIISARPGQDANKVEERVRATADKLDGVRVRYGRVDIDDSIARALR